MANELSAAVFIDRDGTIIEDADYCSHPKQVKVFPGVPEALRRLKSKGFKLIVITNQSGIGRGFFTFDEYRSVESEVARQLGHGLIDATYFCPDVTGSTFQSPEAVARNDFASQARVTKSIWRVRFLLVTRRSTSSAVATQVCAQSGFKLDLTATSVAALRIGPQKTFPPQRSSF